MMMDMSHKDLRHIPRERWSTVLGMIFVQKCPEAALTQIVLEGKSLFIKRNLAIDTFGLKYEDYSDIWLFIRLAVQNANQQRALLKAKEDAGFIIN